MSDGRTSAQIRNEDSKRANILVKFLPVNIVSELQRRFSPTLLGDATYDEISNHLYQHFSTSKSTVGAAVKFLTYKQQSRQSIKDYSRKLNSLACQCNYPVACLRVLVVFYVTHLSLVFCLLSF